MSLHISSSQAKTIGIIGIAVMLIVVIWFVFSSSSEESEMIGCVGKTKTFACGDTITESCAFNGDINSSSMIGFTIGADNITIDGKGHSLIGPGEQSGEEAFHCKGHSNITIKNLNIDYYFGIFFKDVTDSEITGCTISFDKGSAIWLWSSSHNKITGNKLGPGTGGHGILLWGSSNENIIEDNNIQTVQGGGIFIEDNSNDNELYDNFLCGNTRGYIVVDSSSIGNSGNNNTFDTAINFEDENRNPCPE